MNKLSEEKVFRDPIHGYVRVDDSVVWQCIQTKEFQRLRRIKQLGSTSMAYHTGEHSRFAHSLGVYEIVRRMVNEVGDLKEKLTEYEKITVMLAGLLHDIGHAPFSHSFETIMHKKHEEYTVQIISQKSEIKDILDNYSPHLADDVAKVIDGSHPNGILCQMVSSQLDADRMDYLLRDSYFTGTKYGEFDLERILRTMRVADDKLAVKVSGMHTIEDYIMARYHMYWQVYFHAVSRSYDVILKNLFKRLVDLYKENPTKILDEYPMYRNLLTKEILSNEDIFDLDDSTCLYSFRLMSKGDDKILADLAMRLLTRNLFKYSNPQNSQDILSKLKEKGYDKQYYFYWDHQTQNPYTPYNGQTHSIWVLMDNGEIAELSSVSKIVSSICQNSTYQDEKIFFPKEVL
ncbi:MAG: HD domain-containing protein [Erysipelotrichia bacterium]|nr:HD domain-containing protein [Erysipelotrichia bacterium]